MNELTVTAILDTANIVISDGLDKPHVKKAYGDLILLCDGDEDLVRAAFTSALLAQHIIWNMFPHLMFAAAMRCANDTLDRT